MNRSGRSISNYLSGLLFTAVMLAAGLLSTPLLLRWLGRERLGAYRAAADWMGCLTLLELGLGGSALALLARATGRRDQQTVRDVLSVSVRGFLRVTLLMLVGGAFLAIVVGRLVPVGDALAADLRLGLCVGLLSLLLTPLLPLRLLAEAEQRGYIVNCLLMAQGLTATGLSLLLARMRWGISGQFTAMVGGSIVFYLGLAWDARGRVPMRPAFVAGLERDSVRRELRALNWPTLVFNFAGRISLLSDNIVIAMILGPGWVVPFFVTQRLIGLAQSQLQGIGSATWASLVELQIGGRQEAFVNRLLELTQLVAILAVAVLAPLAAWNHRFVALWVGPANFGGEWVGALAALNGLLLAMLSLWGWVFTGSGRVGALMPLMLISATVNLLASVAATLRLGIVGPLVGTAVAFVLVNVWWLPLLLRRHFQVPLNQLLAAVAWPVALGVPYAAALWQAAHLYPPPGWSALAAEIVGSAIFFVAACWCIALSRARRRDWIQRTRLLANVFRSPDESPATVLSR
jgi:O-antigen/teichoic acid export membrane protein